MNSSSDITIGMVTYNRLELTKKTFVGALTNTGKKFNLVIADNASTDGTVEWLEENIKTLPNIAGYKIKKLSKNYGIAYGRNVCLKLTENFPETKYICTLDNDVSIPNQNWLQDCCDVVDSDKKIGCCAVNFESKEFPVTNIKTKDGRLIKVKIIKNTPGTACIVFRKEIFDKIGYFKRYNDGIYGHEDANICLRTRMVTGILLYLYESGIHLGEGEYDTGPYREMKTKQFNENYHLFVKDLQDYHSGRQPLYIDFKEEE